MKVISATRLMREAATVLRPVRDDVTVVGAIAVEVALDAHEVVLTPTRDVDAGLRIDAVDRVVATLEEHGMGRSPIPHERPFTWVKGDLKVQLIRPFHPFPRLPAKTLPVNNLVAELAAHRVLVAFEDAPESGALWVATPAALVAFKGEAFGRTRPTGQLVERDFSDAHLLIDRLSDEIVHEARGFPQLRHRVRGAAKRLEADGARIAARQLVAIGEERSQRAAELHVRRAARALLDALQAT